MRGLLIKYAVLYSKAGYAPAAAILCRWLEDMRRPRVEINPARVLDAVQEELAYAGAPTWLFNSLLWHLAEMREKVQAGHR